MLNLSISIVYFYLQNLYYGFLFAFFIFVGKFYQARYDALLSIPNSRSSVFILWKIGYALANAIISVVHTGVKSPGMTEKYEPIFFVVF